MRVCTLKSNLDPIPVTEYSRRSVPVLHLIYVFRSVRSSHKKRYTVALMNAERIQNMSFPYLEEESREACQFEIQSRTSVSEDKRGVSYRGILLVLSLLCLQSLERQELTLARTSRPLEGVEFINIKCQREPGPSCHLDLE